MKAGNYKEYERINRRKTRLSAGQNEKLSKEVEKNRGDSRGKITEKEGRRVLKRGSGSAASSPGFLVSGLRWS